MSFPPAFLDELRTRLTLSGVVGKRLKLVRAGREYKGCCPFHHEKTPSFYVNDDKQFYHCFGCGAHGDIIGFTMHMDHLSFPEAIEILAGQAGLSVPQDTPQERQRYDLEKRLFDVMERATAWFEEQLFAPVGREALAYLRGRGLTPEAMRRYHLGYAPADAKALVRKLGGDGFSAEEMKAVGLVKQAENKPDLFSFFRNRVMFPVGDRRGRTVAFGGRVMDDGEPKYLNSPDHALFHKGKLLYGLSRARAAATQGQPLIVVEGYMDVIALVEAGYVGAVAPLGTALTEDQIALLWKMLPPPDSRDPSRDYSPILCFDGDSAGLRAAVRGVDRALPLLTTTQTVRVAYLPEGEDPDSLLKQSGKNGMQPVLDQAKPMIDVLWDLTMAGRRLQTPEERGSFIQAIKARVAQIKDENLRHLYQDDIAQRINGLFQRPAPYQPKGQKQAFGGKDKYGKGRNLQASEGLISRHSPKNQQRTKEKIFLALMINHPALFAEYGEELGRMSFTNRDLEAIRQHYVDLLSSDSHETLDASELYRHLSEVTTLKVEKAGLGEVLSESTYLYAPFARPDRTTEQARYGWKSIWNKHLQELIQADLQAALALYKEDASEANEARLMALRAQIEGLNRESAGGDSLDNAFSTEN